MERYLGLDVHAASSTLVVLSEAGRRLKRCVLETNGQALVEAIRMIPGRKHLCFDDPRSPALGVARGEAGEEGEPPRGGFPSGNRSSNFFGVTPVGELCACLLHLSAIKLTLVTGA